MTCVFFLDVPENNPISTLAAEDPRVVVDRVGPYYRLTSDDAIEIDRRASGARHAVWYSCISGLTDSRVVKWDKDSLRIVAL